MTKMKDIIIIGAGGFGREVFGIIKNCNAKTQTWNILGFVDDGKQKGELINGLPILGGVGYINEVTSETAVVIAISLPTIRKEIFERITNPLITFPTIIHPSNLISDPEFVSYGQGCVFCINTVFTTNITLGDFVLVNAGTVVNHDAIIDSYATLMPSVNISTGAHIGEGCYIGTGTKISIPQIIKDWQKLPSGTIIA